MELKVQLPMTLEVNNKGAYDIANNWSIGGRTKHIDTKQYFLRQLKEEGIIKVVWIPGSKNDADIFTKNLPSPDFRKHRQKYCEEETQHKYSMSKGVC